MAATGRFLLDTNIIIALLEDDEAVLSSLDQVREVFIPAVALGELFFGAAKSGRPVENTAKVEWFAAGRSVLPCDVEVAREYGQLRFRFQQSRHGKYMFVTDSTGCKNPLEIRWHVGRELFLYGVWVGAAQSLLECVHEQAFPRRDK